jgi:WD40 repeat protein
MKLTLSQNHRLPTGVLGLAHQPDGSTAFAACADGAIYQLDPTTGQADAFAEKHTSFASGCVLLPGGRTLISSGYDGQLLWHDVATKQCWRRVQAHQFWSRQLALSPDGRHLATVTGQYLAGGWKYEPAAATEPTVKVFDTLTGDLTAAFTHGPPVLSCAFTPDSQHLAAANMMGDIGIWLPTGHDGQPIASWNTPDFTSWGTTKSHHYCGGIHDLAFSPDGSILLACGMGPMGDPMAGNGKMTWQRWNWLTGQRLDQIKDGQHGTGLMEALAWHPDGTHFLMAGRQAQGTWNAALFSAADGSLVHSLDVKHRITQARFTPDGQSLLLSITEGQPAPKAGIWPPWGRFQKYTLET